MTSHFNETEKRMCINMSLNVNESDKNDLLSNIDLDTNFKRLTYCEYFDTTSFKSNFKNDEKMSIFHTNIRSSAKNLSQLKYYLGALEFNFNSIGISEN